jgi:hypothetical protein
LKTRSDDSDSYLGHDLLISWLARWRVEFDVAAARAAKRAEWDLVLRAILDPSEKPLTLRSTQRPTCQEDLPVPDIGNMPTLHRLLALGAAWRNVSHVSAYLQSCPRRLSRRERDTTDPFARSHDVAQSLRHANLGREVRLQR